MSTPREPPGPTAPRRGGAGFASRSFGWVSGSLLAHALIAAVAIAGEQEPSDSQASALDAPETQLTQAAEERWVDVSSLGSPAEELPRPNVEPQAPAAEPQAPAAEPQAPAAEPASDAPPGPAPRAKAPAKPREPTTQAPAPKAPSDESERGEDWLRIEDQLPAEAPAKAPVETAVEKPDPIVERLLAAERRKAQHAAQRRAAAEAAPVAPSEVPLTSPEVKAPPEANAPQDLGDRFTRAVTEAEKNNSVWSTRALGWVGRVRLTLTLRNGVLGPPEFDGEPDPLLVRLVEKTLFLLRRGTFALPFSDQANGTQRFEIAVRLSVVDDVNRYAYERPTPKRPGRAFFVLPDGRLFEAFVDPNVEQ